jgi:hypothetical protein
MYLFLEIASGKLRLEVIVFSLELSVVLSKGLQHLLQSFKLSEDLAELILIFVNLTNVPTGFRLSPVEFSLEIAVLLERVFKVYLNRFIFLNELVVCRFPTSCLLHFEPQQIVQSFEV